MDIFAPGYPINGCFVVLNTSPQIKTINIFQYPINYMTTRNLLLIPGVAEQDIRASLLKGELNYKIRAHDIQVVCSDIDLLQFNTAQQTFLQNAGIVNGLSVNSSGVSSDDFLLNNNPMEPNNTYNIYYNNGQVSSETWTNNTTGTLIKQINYTFTGSVITRQVRQVFDSTGVNIIAQLTISSTYSGTTLTSYTAVRDI